eukprot:6210649-Pleurochrysis_carterae.AAC.9
MPFHRRHAATTISLRRYGIIMRKCRFQHVECSIQSQLPLPCCVVRALQLPVRPSPCHAAEP